MSSRSGPDAPAPVDLVDSFGRVHRDLRISVTDRCDFRCSYCMPADGLSWVPRDDVLTYEEIGRIARVLVQRLGITSIRLTGGEPTVRADLDHLIRELAPLGTDLSMTTNGASLGRRAAELHDAGLRRLNVSLDSLRPERFAAITRRDALASVLAGIDAAVAVGFDPVKVNVVLMAGVNDDEIVDFARFGRDRGVIVRFIEFMPLDADGRWDGSDVVGREAVLAAVGSVFPIEPLDTGSARRGEPAERFGFTDLQSGSPGSEIGVIPSVTAPFCDTCDRIRLTAEGSLRNCLFSVTETDLRSMLRGGCSDDDLIGAVRACISDKAAGHGIGTPAFIRPHRSMSQIGG